MGGWAKRDKGSNDKGGVCAWKSRMEDRGTAADEDKLSALPLLIKHEVRTHTHIYCKSVLSFCSKVKCVISAPLAKRITFQTGFPDHSQSVWSDKPVVEGAAHSTEHVIGQKSV